MKLNFQRIIRLFLITTISATLPAFAQLTASEAQRVEEIEQAIKDARSSSRASNTLKDQIAMAQEQVDFAQGQLDAIYNSTGQKFKETASHITLGTAAMASGVVFIKMLAKAEKQDLDNKLILHSFSYIYGFLGLG